MIRHGFKEVKVEVAEEASAPDHAMKAGIRVIGWRRAQKVWKVPYLLLNILSRGVLGRILGAGPYVW